MRKGSAIIIVVVSMTYLILLTVPLIIISCTDTKMSHSNGSLSTAYYIGEAGWNRSIDIIKDEINSYFKDLKVEGNEKSSTPGIDYIKSVFDDHFTPYFSHSFFSNLNIYNFFNMDDGTGENNGSDTSAFSSIIGSPSYYKISSVAVRQTTLSKDEAKSIYNFKIPVQLAIEGHSGLSSREVKSWVTIDIYLNSLLQKDGSTGSATDYDSIIFNMSDLKIDIISWI